MSEAGLATSADGRLAATTFFPDFSFRSPVMYRVRGVDAETGFLVGSNLHRGTEWVELTSNDFRFQMRVWFLKETDSICTSCGRGCNTVIGAREGKVYRQTPRENNEVNSTWMCDRGRLDFHYLYSESRLTDPMIKASKENASVCSVIAA